MLAQEPESAAPESLVTRPLVDAKWMPWKRATDLLLGVPLTLIALPIIGILAILIRLDSRGPAFFRQERIGLQGVPFRIWKLRSMVTDAADQHHRAAATAWFLGKPAPSGYKGGDPRITRMGRFLRATSLDELPQLFNVLSGEMSLVGPRPAIAYELELYEPWYMGRFACMPGMTGLWQVSGRDKRSAPEMMAMDIRYVAEASPWRDLGILIKTVPAVLR